MWHGFWTPNEFDFKSDYSQFKSDLSPALQGVYTRSIGAIGQVEIAPKTFWGRLHENLPHPSIADLGFVLANTEVIHNIAYEKPLEILDLNDIFEEMLKEPAMEGRVKYLKKYADKVYKDDKKQFIYSIILFTLFVENVSLFSQFYIILWMNRFKNVMKDTAQQVQYTRNEENLHAQVGIWLINTLRQEYPELFDEELEQRIFEEIEEAFTSESNIIDWILQGYEDEGLDADLLKQYIRHRISSSMLQIGYNFNYKAERYQEFKWMDEELHGNNMTDFFHKKPVDYSKNNKTYNEEEVF